MLSFVIGTLIGTVCGYAGGRIDIIVMRLVDAVQAFPNLIFSISVAAMLGSGLKNCIIAMVIQDGHNMPASGQNKSADD